MRSTILLSLVVTAVMFTSLAGASAQPPALPPPQTGAAAQPAAVETLPKAEAAYPWEGEINGSNVYVRSGAGVNWYPTTKLNTGDRVLVLSEKFGWYQIVPPKGSFSYVDKAMVDRQPDGKTGIIKQDKVYVRAGSEVEDRKSATQLVLDKGAKVEITGEAEGFFRINPPKGAALYVSKAYVEPVPERLRTGLAEQHTEGTTPKAPSGAVRTVVPAEGAPSPAVAATSDSSTGQEESLPLEVEPTIEALRQNIPRAAEPPATVAGPSGGPKPPADTTRTQEPPKVPELPPRPRYEVMLQQLENLLQAELRRPIHEQDITALLNRYEEIAAQKEEDVPSRVAKIRLQQLRDWQSLLITRGDSNTNVTALQEFRAQLQEKRREIEQRRIEQATVKYDLEGELRKSYAFAAQQRRYRLVDPARGSTIAYVDVPPTVDVNVENLIGRVVGIRASEKHFSPSARVPIAVAKDVVDLSPRTFIVDPGGPQ